MKKGNLTMELLVSIILLSILFSISFIVPRNIIEKVKFEQTVRLFINDVNKCCIEDLNGEKNSKILLFDKRYIIKKDGEILERNFGNKSNIVIHSKSTSISFKNKNRYRNAVRAIKVYFY